MWRKITDYFKNLEKNITKDFTPFQINLWNLFLFLTTFAVLALVLHFLVWVNWNPISVQIFHASVVSKILNLLGLNTFHSGTFIHVSGFGLVEIVKDCLGWKSMVALLGLIIATRKISWKNKVLGFLWGVVIIFIGNIVRLTTTIYSVVKLNINFELVHSLIWQWGLTLLIILIWFFWMRMSLSKSKKG